MNTTVPYITDDFIENNCHFNDLVEALKDGFSTSAIEVPMRHHHDFHNPDEDKDSTYY